MIIKDIHVEQSIELNFSHFKAESVYFLIKYTTPIGQIFVDPSKHHSFTWIGDIERIAQDIEKGLKTNKQIIKTGCAEPLFDITIERAEDDEEEILSLRLGIDLRKILLDQPNYDGPCMTLSVNRAILYDLIGFFNDIVKKYKS